MTSLGEVILLKAANWVDGGQMLSISPVDISTSARIRPALAGKNFRHIRTAQTSGRTIELK